MTHGAALYGPTFLLARRDGSTRRQPLCEGEQSSWRWCTDRVANGLLFLPSFTRFQQMFIRISSAESSLYLISTCFTRVFMSGFASHSLFSGANSIRSLAKH